MKSSHVRPGTSRGSRPPRSLRAAVALLLATIAAATLAWPASAVPPYPTDTRVYLDENDIPRNGVAYNVAVLYRDYTEAAGNPVFLPEGIDSTLTISNATAVKDEVAVADTNEATITLAPSKLPGSAAFKKSWSTTYTRGTTKTFTQTNSIKIRALTSDLTATPTYYRTQMSGDRWIFRDGTLRRVSTQPNSFTADIVRGEGWEIRTSSGRIAVAGKDYK